MALLVSLETLKPASGEDGELRDEEKLQDDMPQTGIQPQGKATPSLARELRLGHNPCTQQPYSSLVILEYQNKKVGRNLKKNYNN